MKKNPIRIVSATSLFDGHDVTINIIRRLLQDFGAEIIHLGHNRSVQEIVTAALQEGAQGVAVSSYQGGHVEYYKYLKNLLNQSGASYVQIFGGGGGVIIHEEKKIIEEYGIRQIFHPDDGRKLGLEGMIKKIIESCDFDPITEWHPNGGFHASLGMAITSLENHGIMPTKILESFINIQDVTRKSPPILGVTGTGGAGKSSLVDELIQRIHTHFQNKKIAVLCIDPTKRKTGGALLGDRIRMNAIHHPEIFVRSMASRGSSDGLSVNIKIVLEFLKSLNFDLIIIESSGIGQSGSNITHISNHSLYVMTSEFGAQSQLEKIDMLDYADFVAINKADHCGAQDALRDVKNQIRRSRKLSLENDFPIFLTQAAQFNDLGINHLFLAICNKLGWEIVQPLKSSKRRSIIPAERVNYLSDIVTTVRNYKRKTEELSQLFSRLGAFEKIRETHPDFEETFKEPIKEIKKDLKKEDIDLHLKYEKLKMQYSKSESVYVVRGEEIRQPLIKKSLSGLTLRRVTFPRISDWGDQIRFLRLENVPGEFPFTAGVFPLKREGEEPERQFAGEGSPEKTNRRFHFLTKESKAKRLSTAFDSVTLYGQDPDRRPDIFGKVGESGVSICTLEDMKKLYEGFDLCDPQTSISMTINGPAPMILAFFFNTAIDQQVDKKEQELGRPLRNDEFEEIKILTLKQVRGTVQADILKEDQGQNTCIFSIDFALKLMGDVQEYFIENQIKNFYSVSISGYHIAEAGANPITQLAFTLANGFTYVEYFLSRGMKIDDFAPNLSFFFSNGLDPEYSVIGRVARRIWAIVLRDLYKGHERSQKLKYHIQTSGRSLHSQEIDFNDIRTTLQALLAVCDNCNSLHTNAFDEAITTPTEHSVRRAMAIQKIIGSEFGITKNENPFQGSYFIEELTDLVEEAVLDEFLRLNERGGVLGAMERQYQRGRIQDESLYYESLKHSGELPIIGVNTFINPKTLLEDYIPPKIEMARATQEEKNGQYSRLQNFKMKHQSEAQSELEKLKMMALENKNIFDALMSASRVCSLEQMTQALYEVGGQYRRNL